MIDFQAQLNEIDRKALDLWDANCATPYVHADYDRADMVYTAHLVVAFGLDMAERVRDMWSDCQEDVRYMVAYLMQEDAWQAQADAELAAEIRAESAVSLAKAQVTVTNSYGVTDRVFYGLPAFAAKLTAVLLSDSASIDAIDWQSDRVILTYDANDAECVHCVAFILPNHDSIGDIRCDLACAEISRDLTASANPWR